MCPPKRRSIERSNAPGRNKELCLFCESICPEPLHEFTTFNSNKSVNEMATAMGDRDLVVKLSEGDLVAIEAKYHFSCLSKYRNEYRAHVRASASSSSNYYQCSADNKAKALALVAYIESMIEEGNQIFNQSDLHASYQNCLKKVGLDTSAHKTRLKKGIIDHFLDSGVQEQSDGNNTLLVFPKGM